MNGKNNKIDLFISIASLLLVIIGIISYINNEPVPPTVFLLTSIGLFLEHQSHNIQS